MAGDARRIERGQTPGPRIVAKPEEFGGWTFWRWYCRRCDHESYGQWSTAEAAVAEGDGHTCPPGAPGGRVSAREIADLLRDHRAMIDDAGGCIADIPPDRLAAWEARKHDLLARIETQRGGTL